MTRFLAFSLIAVLVSGCVVLSRHHDDRTPAVVPSQTTVGLAVQVVMPTASVRLDTHRRSHNLHRSLNWQALAFCESRLHWHEHGASTPYSGGLQFAATTWTSFGGARYAATAWQATRTQQITVALRVLAVQGWAAWPACTRQLGWR